MPPRIQRNVDPDGFLQRVVDVAQAEVARIEAKQASNSPKCAACGGGGHLDRDERRFLTDTLKELRSIVFGARKLLNDRHLRGLGDKALNELNDAVENEGGEWLPR